MQFRIKCNMRNAILIYSDASGGGNGGYASYFGTENASILLDSSYSHIHGINGLNDNCDINMDSSHQHLE